MSGPFFIVGSARSGTTMLRMMMNAHPLVAVPPESRFVVELWPGRDAIDSDAWLEQLAAHERFVAWDLPVDAVRAEMGERTTVAYHEAVDAAFTAYARARGKIRWGDKTPRYIEHIELLASLFPDARFVHVVRDGRNVALSYADVPFGPKTVARAAALWRDRVRAGMRAGRSLGAARYLELRYEDVVAGEEAVAATARRLSDFLELEFHADMLDPATHARAEVLARASLYNPHVVGKPIAATRSWERDMAPPHVEVFEAVAGGLLSELGYPRRHPAPRAGARARARLGRAGLPLGRLRPSSTDGGKKEAGDRSPRGHDAEPDEGDGAT